MLMNRNRKFNPKRLWLFEGDPEGGKGPVTPPEPITPPAPAQKADDANKPPAANPELEAYKARETALQKELDKYKTEEQKRKDADKTAAEKLTERETELNKLKRENLIERVRRENGFAAKVFDSVQPAGEDAEAIKAAFEAHKTALDDYVKTSSAKPGQGGGTSTGNPDGKTKPDASVPILVRFGMVQPKAAI